MIFNIIISSLINGSTYALLAIGFSLVFGVARIVNIAHTAFFMVASYCIFLCTNILGLNPFAAMMVTIILTVLLGLIIFKIIIDPLREHEAAVLIATVALAMSFQETMLLFFGGVFQSLPYLVTGNMEIAGIRVAYQQLLIIAMAPLVLAAVWIFLKKTRMGLAIRATSQDREVANLMGMNEKGIAMMTMAVSVALAAFTGAVVVPLSVVHPHMWLHPLVMTMAAVVLGGMGSVKGSFIGAYILGFAEALVVFLIPMGAFLKGSVALSIMVFVLLLRPDGLFGVTFEEER
ncbi:MAG: branched-chain amino acid ABC transporter permease [Deltaproteobacteria bacterium]|nr:branched-chain amino acid ABC transporter permease [Deltaproteobacteria bacterium]